MKNVNIAIGNVIEVIIERPGETHHHFFAVTLEDNSYTPCEILKSNHWKDGGKYYWRNLISDATIIDHGPMSEW